MLEGLESHWVCGVLVDSTDPGGARMGGLEPLAEEAFNRIRIARRIQHEVQRATRGIDGAVEVIPALLDLDIGLNPPGTNR